MTQEENNQGPVDSGSPERTNAKPLAPAVKQTFGDRMFHVLANIQRIKDLWAPPPDADLTDPENQALAAMAMAVDSICRDAGNAQTATTLTTPQGITQIGVSWLEPDSGINTKLWVPGMVDPPKDVDQAAQRKEAIVAGRQCGKTRLQLNKRLKEYVLELLRLRQLKTGADGELFWFDGETIDTAIWVHKSAAGNLVAAIHEIVDWETEGDDTLPGVPLFYVDDCDDLVVVSEPNGLQAKVKMHRAGAGYQVQLRGDFCHSTDELRDYMDTVSAAAELLDFYQLNAEGEAGDAE